MGTGALKQQNAIADGLKCGSFGSAEVRFAQDDRSFSDWNI